jgi:membrane protease YdiL (CAAX protease family)
MRAFAWFLGVILLAGLIAAALAYPAFEFTQSFANWAFHRVASRIAMLVLIMLLIWLCRHLHITTKGDFGYGLPLAAVSQGVPAVGSDRHDHCRRGRRLPAGDAAARSAPRNSRSRPRASRASFSVGLGSGIAVALLEETVFRGAMHTAIERESGPMDGGALTAPLFAVLHFFAKVRIEAADVGWGSGFALLQRSFAPLAHPALVFDSFLSWLAVGLILSLTRVLTGNIAVAIGLHAGWVVVLRMLQQSTSGGSAPAYSAWVGRFDGLLGYWMLPWGLAIAAALWLARHSWVAYARGLK